MTKPSLPIAIFLVTLLSSCGDPTELRDASTDAPDASDPPDAADATMTDVTTATFRVESVEVESVEELEAIISYSLTEPGSAFIEFGIDESYGSRNGGETDLLDFHRQRLRDLLPDTGYHFRVVAENAAGDIAMSPDGEFNTGDMMMMPPRVEGWPSDAESYDEDLPMSGVFYGSPMIGTYGAGNSSIALEHAWSFRAERTGPITHVAWQNRRLTQATIDDRSSFDDGYVECIRLRLTANQCAYTRGNAYHVGNGGRLQVFIYPESTTDPGQPDEDRLIAQMPTYFIPGDNPANAWIEHELASPADVVAGNTYFAIIRNLAPPTTALTRLSYEEARRTDPDTGAISLNGLVVSESPDEDAKFGPYYASENLLHRKNDAGRWIPDRRNVPWWTVRYADGVVIGQTWRCNDCFRTYTDGHLRAIEGDIRARQTFTVQDTSRNANGVWLAYGHTNEVRRRGPLTVELKNDAGVVLFSGELPTDPAVAAQAAEFSPSLRNGFPIVWRHLVFPSTIRLEEGETYYLEMSAGDGAGFALTAYALQPAADRNNRTLWGDAGAEISTDDGDSWSSLGRYRDADLPVLFTLEGMPRDLR